jgi:hypothetical protein
MQQKTSFFTARRYERAVLKNRIAFKEELIMRITKISLGLKGQVNMGNNEWYQPEVHLEAEVDESEDLDKSIQLLRLLVQKQIQNDIIYFRKARKIVTAVPIREE